MTRAPQNEQKQFASDGSEFGRVVWIPSNNVTQAISELQALEESVLEALAGKVAGLPSTPTARDFAEEVNKPLAKFASLLARKFLILHKLDGLRLSVGEQSTYFGWILGAFGAALEGIDDNLTQIEDDLETRFNDED